MSEIGHVVETRLKKGNEATRSINRRSYLSSISIIVISFRLRNRLIISRDEQ